MRHRGQKRFESTHAVIALPIDEETRRAVDTGTHPAPEIFSNSIGMSARSEFLNKTRFVQAKRNRVLGQRLVTERILISKEHFVHRPKSSLFSGSFRGLGRVLGVRMDVRQGKVPEGETEFVSKPALNFSDKCLSFAAKRTFVISVLE
jgi:hypothetical protein